MTTRPEVLAVRRSGSGVELNLRIPESLVYLRDHFRRCALVPGVVQVDWAIAYAREQLGLGGAFRRLAALKFTHPLLPNVEVTLTLARNAAGELAFSYRNSRQAYSEGRIAFRAPDD